MYPILFENGPFVLFTHDVFTALGLLAGLALYYRELHRRDMLGPRIFWISIAAIIGGGIGARLSVVWEHPAYYTNIGSVPLTYFFAHSGKSIIGGIVGGYIAIALAKRAFHYTRSTGDCYAAAIPLAMVIGRVGCFLSELPLGKPTDLPWGMTVSQAAAQHFEVCPYCTQPMHPSMLYEIAFHLLAFVLILRYRHLIMVQGDALKIYLLCALVFRFMVEFVRANPEMLWGLTSAQVALIPLSLPLLYHFARNWKRGVYSMPRPPLPAADDGRWTMDDGSQTPWRHSGQDGSNKPRRRGDAEIRMCVLDERCGEAPSLNLVRAVSKDPPYLIFLRVSASPRCTILPDSVHFAFAPSKLLAAKDDAE